MREFLTTRRARITPDQVGPPDHRQPAGCPDCGAARSPSLAGLSVEYYARLERGQIAGASAGVLDALARALQLDETERAHLLDLARAADGIPTSGRARRRTAEQGRLPAQPAVGAGGDHRRCRVRPRPAPEPARHQRAGPRVLLTRHRRRRPDCRTSPGSSSSTPPPATSTPTGTCSPRCASGSCAPRPAATPTTADCRTSSASSPPERDLPAPVGRPQRPHPRRRHQAVPPPGRRRADPRLRGARHHRRTRPRADGLHRRTRLALGRTPPSARLLGSTRRPVPNDPTTNT